MSDALKVLDRDWLTALRAQGTERAQGLIMALGLDQSAGGSYARLVELATTSQDPALLAWSMRACGGDAGCAGASPRLWAAHDVGNLAPWLAEFQRAAASGESGSLREALYQIGQAQRNDDYSRLTLGLLEQARHTENPGLRSAAEAEGLTGVYMAQVRVNPWRALRGHCLAAVAQQDVEEQRLCETALDAVWRLDDTLAGATMAQALARQLPHANAALWRERGLHVDAYKAVQSEEFDAYRDLIEAGRPCVADAQLRAYLRRLAQFGERGALEAQLKGRDIAQVSAAYRAAMSGVSAPNGGPAASP